MKEEKFRIKNRKDLEIVGVVSIPEGSSGLVFVMHGLSGYKEQAVIETTVDSFLDHNYVVVNFDATNSANESGGEYKNATAQNHYEDLVDVVYWAKTMKWYREPFAMAGESFGAYAVARYAEEYPNEVKALGLISPFVAGELSYKAKEKFETEKFKKWKETGWDEKESISRPGLIHRLPWSHMEERLKHDLRPSVLKLNMPVLLVSGENDSSYKYGNHKILFDILPGPKEMHVISNAPHYFIKSIHLIQLRNILDEWLGKLEKLKN